MKKNFNYIIKIDDGYVTGFEGKRSFGKTSHNGWNQQFTELGEVELSMHNLDAKVFEGKVNLKSALDKLYDRMRYSDLSFRCVEIVCQEEDA